MYEVPEHILREMRAAEEARRNSSLPHNHPEFPLAYDGFAPIGARCSICERDLSGDYFEEEDGLFVCHSSEGCDEHSAEEDYISKEEFLALSPSAQEDLVYAAHNEAEEEDMLLPVISAPRTGLLALSDAEKELPGENLFRWSSLYVQVQGETLHLYEIRETDCAVFWAGPLERSYKLLVQEEADPLEEEEPLSFKITSENGEIRCECNMPYAGHRTWVLRDREFFSCSCDHTSWEVCKGHIFGHEEPLVPVAAEDVPLTARTLLLAAASCL